MESKRFEMALIFVVIFATLAFVSAGCASAATHYVNPGESIQAVVNAADLGDTIIVRDGIYTENVDMNKSLTIQSDNGSVNCIIQAANSYDHIFEVTANYVNISGFTVKDASYDAGIYLYQTDYCTISSNKASNNRCGIRLRMSSNNALTSNNASNNEHDGISLGHYSNNNVITDNTANSNKMVGIALMRASNNTLIHNTNNLNERGIYFLDSSNNTITNNNCSNNDYGGITLSSGSPNNILINNTANTNKQLGLVIRWAANNNTLRNNTISGNKYNFHAEGIQDIDTSNKINGKSIRYLVNEKDQVVDSNFDVGYLGIVNSRNITVRDLILTNNSEGILLDHSSDAKIENFTAVNCEYGIYLKSSSNNTVTNNKASYDSTGIYLQNASDNVISNNNASNNTIGIYLWAYSNNNTLTYNTVNFNRHYGIGFSNVISNNIYLNNFNNSKNVRPSGQTNTSWNSTSKITYTYNGNTYSNYMGNYWSDYNGSGSNGDGIGDTPYCMDSHRDYRPLMQPWENYFAPALLVLDTGACTYPQHTSGKIYDN